MKTRLGKVRKLAECHRASERRSWSSKPDVFTIHILFVIASNSTVILGCHGVGARKEWLLRCRLVPWPCTRLNV